MFFIGSIIGNPTPRSSNHFVYGIPWGFKLSKIRSSFNGHMKSVHVRMLGCNFHMRFLFYKSSVSTCPQFSLYYTIL
jgi:hypothetical protein